MDYDRELQFLDKFLAQVKHLRSELEKTKKMSANARESGSKKAINNLNHQCEYLDDVKYKTWKAVLEANQYLETEKKKDEFNNAPSKKRLSAAFFYKYGFSKPSRCWVEERGQFSVYYTIEGYDCKIIVRISPQMLPYEMSGEKQMEEFSDIKILEEHHYGDFQVFVNSFENHLTTLNYENELLELMSVCGEPLIGSL